MFQDVTNILAHAIGNPQVSARRASLSSPFAWIKHWPSPARAHQELPPLKLKRLE
jgi:hypothetical protein